MNTCVRSTINGSTSIKDSKGYGPALFMFTDAAKIAEEEFNKNPEQIWYGEQLLHTMAKR